MQLNIGTTLQNGKYKIVSVLGQGGFGITYLASQTTNGYTVAIKEFFPKDFCGRDTNGNITVASDTQLMFIDKLKQKFYKEAQRVQNLRHPNIIHCYETFQENGTAYYVMDYIQGDNLMNIVRNHGPFALDKAINIILEVGSALAYIHSMNINHLDVKPANIMWSNQALAPILIDFGISKQYNLSGDATSTTPVGISKGFAPIEQYTQDGVSTFSPQIDVYSLSATLYYLLTGQTPPEATLLISSELPKDNRVPSHIYKVISKGMSPNSSARYQSISALCEDISTEEEETDLIAVSNRKAPITIINGHEAMDTGLSVLWATCDIGATDEFKRGESYLWGDPDGTKTRKIRNSTLMRWFCSAPSPNNISNNPRFDTATALWGKGWRMPTIAEVKELFNKSEWLIYEGTHVRLFGPNGFGVVLDNRRHWTAECQYGGMQPFFWSADDAHLYLNLPPMINENWSELYFPIRPVADRKQ